MANAVNGNTVYIDSTGDVLTGKRITVNKVILTPTSATAVVVLQDYNATSPVNKIDFRAATSGDSKVLDLVDTPIIFPNGIKIATLTNCIVTLLYNSK